MRWNTTWHEPVRCPETGKTAHPDAQSAAVAAEHIRRTNGTRLWAYQCPSCHAWHLTHHDPARHRQDATFAQRKPHAGGRKHAYKPRRR